MHRRVEYKSVKSEVFAAALLRMLELRSFEVTFERWLELGDGGRTSLAACFTFANSRGSPLMAERNLESWLREPSRHRPPT
jgi:hypothetical protein